MGYSLKASITVIALICTIILVSQLFHFPLIDLTKSNEISVAKAETNNATSISFTTLMDRANNLDRIGRYDEAMTYYKKALAIDPTNAIALSGKADDLDNLRNQK